MNDPAVEAAKRAEEASGWWKSGGSTPWDSDYANDSAREALEPIRELHYPVTYATASGVLHMKKVCAHCHRRGLFTLHPEFGDWPCATARLIYPESELS